MTKTADEIRGVRTLKKDVPPVQIMPDNPNMMKMSKDEAVAWGEKYRKALAVGEDARRKAMLDADVEPTEENLEEAATEDAENQKAEIVDGLRAKLADAQEMFEANPKQRGLKANVTKLTKKLDKAEADL